MSGIVGQNLGRGSGLIKVGGVGADSVTGASIADDAVDSEHYTDGSIDAVHLSANSVDSDAYVDGSIDNAHLADDAVGVAELSATGTASSSTFLRGDNAWAAAGVGDGDVTVAKLSTSATETSNVKQRVCKVWINLNGGTAIRDSFNVASITDNGTGDYTVTIDEDLANANYSVTGSNIGSYASSYYTFICSQVTANAVGACRIQVIHTTIGAVDQNFVSVMLFGDGGTG